MSDKHDVFSRDRIVTFAGVTPKHYRKRARRESNEEIMFRTKKKLDFVKFRMLPHIYDAENHSFVTLRGGAVTINLRNSGDVKELMAEINDAITRVGNRIAQEVRDGKGRSE